MAITLRGAQIRNGTIGAAKLNTSDTFDFSSGVLRSASPSGDSDVANKAYVDGVAAGLYWKEPVRVGTTGNITLSGTQTIDGVSVGAGDRVLVLKQTNQTENGIYVCAAGAWSRSADMDAGSEFPSAAVFVSEGTANGDNGFVCTNDGAPNLGSDNIEFVQFTGTGSITAGAGISKAGSTLAVDLDALSGLTFSASGDAGLLKMAIRSTGGLELFGGELEVKRAANGGLQADSNGLAVQLQTNPGLELGGTGLKVRLQTNPGLAIDANGIAVNLDTNPGLELGAGGIKVKVAASNPAIGLDANGLSVLTQANKGLGRNASGLEVLAKEGIQIDSGDGNLHLRLDGSTLAQSGSGAKIADDGVGVAQQGFRYRSDFLTGTTSVYDLSNTVDAKNHDGVRAFLNGQRLRKVASSPADVFEYTVSQDGSTTKVNLGGAMESGDLLTVDYVSD